LISFWGYKRQQLSPFFRSFLFPAFTFWGIDVVDVTESFERFSFSFLISFGSKHSERHVRLPQGKRILRSRHFVRQVLEVRGGRGDARTLRQRIGFRRHRPQEPA
jgi:hypothetical protein